MFAAIGAAMSENMASQADLRELERKLDAHLNDLGRRIDKIERRMDDKDRKADDRRLTFYSILWAAGVGMLAVLIHDKLS